jgi:hypothetical protein
MMPKIMKMMAKMGDMIPVFLRPLIKAESYEASAAFCHLIALGVAAADGEDKETDEDRHSCEDESDVGDDDCRGY